MGICPHCRGRCLHRPVKSPKTYGAIVGAIHACNVQSGDGSMIDGPLIDVGVCICFAVDVIRMLTYQTVGVIHITELLCSVILYSRYTVINILNICAVAV